MKGAGGALQEAFCLTGHGWWLYRPSEIAWTISESSSALLGERPSASLYIILTQLCT